MFKLLKWAVVLVVVLVVAAVVGLYLSLGVIVKRVVQTEGTKQLNVPTTLSSASVGVTSGSIGFKDFAIGSPAGFTAPQMFMVGGLKVDTAGVTHLKDKPLHVTLIAIDGPKLVVEQKGLELNFKKLMDGLPPKGEPSPSTAGDNPTKLIIDKLTVTNPTVQFIPDAGSLAGGAAGNALGAFGDLGKKAAAEATKQADKAVKPMTVTLPTFDVANIGNADGRGQGAEIKDVVVAVVQAMAQQAAKDHNLPIDPALLGGNLDSVKDKAKDAIQDQIQKNVGKLPGGAGDLLKGLGGGKK